MQIAELQSHSIHQHMIDDTKSVPYLALQHIVIYGSICQMCMVWHGVGDHVCILSTILSTLMWCIPVCIPAHQNHVLA